MILIPCSTHATPWRPRLMPFLWQGTTAEGKRRQESRQSWLRWACNRQKGNWSSWEYTDKGLQQSVLEIGWGRSAKYALTKLPLSLHCCSRDWKPTK